jgi:hemoglobin-like flavoprotein
MDATLIQSTFAQIEPKKAELADTFYQTLFERYPAVKPLFKNTDWAMQKCMLVAAVGTIAQHARSPLTIVDTLKKMGARHVGYGAKAEHYPAVGECLLHALKEQLGASWNAEVEASWTEAYQWAAGVMIEGMQDAA